MLDDVYTNLNYFLRWLHILAGITWIGLLYFFNFVNPPFQASLDGELKAKVNPALLGRALFWFRWGAMFTFLMGLTLLLYKYTVGELWTRAEGGMSDRAMWILFGALLGTTMWFNVWFIIWPAQKKILGGLKAGQPHPDAAALAKRATAASKMNTYLSAPMLFAMIAPTHYGTMSVTMLVIVLAVGFGMIKFLYSLAPKVGQTF
ncbi:MAG: urate hydroxylase PuuD [Bdellovibrionota bacterium]